jgi:hypothetical protein
MDDKNSCGFLTGHFLILVSPAAIIGHLPTRKNRRIFRHIARIADEGHYGTEVLDRAAVAKYDGLILRKK